MMTRIALALAATTLLTAGASAADIAMEPAPVPMMAAAPNAFDWSGVYLGVQGGYGFGDSRIDDNGLSTLDHGVDTDGWFAGGVVGGLWQWNALVVGLEAEMNWSGIDGDNQIQPGNFIGTEINWFGSANAKLGYAWDRILFYGTGGVAFANIDTSQRFGALSFSNDENYVGWTVGAGIDYAATDNIIVGVQYRYYDFGSADFNAPAPFTPRDQDLDMHTVSAHVTYKF